MSESQNPQPAGISSLVVALADNNGLVRQKAREELVDIGQPAVPALVTALGHPEEQVRWEAAKALREIADPHSAPALVIALEDKDFDVRWLAAEGLAQIGRKALEPLLRALIDRAGAFWLREGAHHVLKAMSRRGLPEPVEPVLAALEGLEPELVVPPAAKTALKVLRVHSG